MFLRQGRVLPGARAQGWRHGRGPGLLAPVPMRTRYGVERMNIHSEMRGFKRSQASWFSPTVTPRTLRSVLFLVFPAETTGLLQAWTGTVSRTDEVSRDPAGSLLKRCFPKTCPPTETSLWLTKHTWNSPFAAWSYMALPTLLLSQST